MDHIRRRWGKGAVNWANFAVRGNAVNSKKYVILYVIVYKILKMKAITISSLRNRISYFFNLVVNSSEVLIIPRNNTDDGVVILSLKEYNALTETHYLLSSAENRKRLLESINQLESGNTVAYEPEGDAKP